jgi:hypothetical protein
MFLRKKLLKILGVLLLVLVIFFAGILFGYFVPSGLNPSSNMANRNMSLYLYKEIDDNFGSITTKNKDTYDIVGYIPLYKDMGFGIILENGVKTIRIYK